MMRTKKLKRILLAVLIIANLLPLATIFAAGSSSEPEAPYEKVAAKKGDWYYDHMAVDEMNTLVAGYTGNYTGQAKERQIEFNLSERTVLTSISIPYAGNVTEDISLYLLDASGNVYKGFSGSHSNPELLSVAEGTSPEELAKLLNTVYTFSAPGAVILPEGSYTLYLDGQAIPSGDFLVKGYNYEAYAAYLEERQKWAAETGNRTEASKDIGNKELAKLLEQYINGEKSKAEEEWKGASDAFIAPAFSLDQEYVIDMIVLNTWNNGKGAEPGTISILDSEGKAVAAYQSQGGSISGVPNTIWIAAPDIKLSAGNYFIEMSNPAALAYDENGQPIFTVEASVPALPMTDFTGTYRINLDAFKTSTLMGPVTGGEKSFSLMDYEVCIIDKGDSLEAVGRYEGMPYSINLTILERTENYVLTEFDFSSAIPPDANISASAQVTFNKEPGGRVTVSMTGSAVYQRGTILSGDSDLNTYSAVMNGVRVNEELAPFVIAALKKAGGIGNIPGPDGSAQAAAGMLFPPLVGLVVNMIQEAQKARGAKSAKKKVVRDKSWYAAQYPGKTDEQLAWIMMGDALGAGGGDEEDAVSIGDNEKPGGSDYNPPDSVSGQYEGDEEESISEEDLGFGKPDVPAEPEPPKADQTPPEQEVPQPEVPKEPETMVLQTSPNGATTLYVKDPVTGKWHDPEYGTELDVSKYPEWADQMMSDKEFNDVEFDKNTRGEMAQDKINREAMAKIKADKEKADFEDKMADKYGTSDKGELEKIMGSNLDKNLEDGKYYTTVGNVMAAGEVGAVIISSAADVGIDVLSEVDPTGAGKKIRTGYYMAKGVASSVAEKGLDKAGAGDVLEGLIKGTGDAMSKNKDLGFGGKMITRAGGEFAGTMAGAYVRGEDLSKAAYKGMIGGASKATVGAITDKLAGSKPSFTDPGNVGETLKKVYITRYAGAKVSSATTNHFFVKPALKQLQN